MTMEQNMQEWLIPQLLFFPSNADNFLLLITNTDNISSFTR